MGLDGMGRRVKEREEHEDNGLRGDVVFLAADTIPIPIAVVARCHRWEPDIRI